MITPAPKHSHEDRPAYVAENTRVKIRLSSLWGIIVSIIATTVWLTILLQKAQFANELEHGKLMYGLTELNAKSFRWVTADQVEEAIVFASNELTGVDTNLNRWRDLQLREGLRQRLRTPKDR